MEDIVQQPTRKPSKAMFKAIIFMIFNIGAIFLIRFTPVRNYLTAEALGSFLTTAGLWAPVAYMAIYALGVCLFLHRHAQGGLGLRKFGGIGVV